MSAWGLFKFGGVIGGLMRQLKMMMILIAVIAVVSYLQATRMDAKKAAAAGVEIEQLVRINQVKARQLEIQTNLTAQYQRQSADNRGAIDAAKDKAREELDRINRIKEEGEGVWCAIDCRVP